MMDATPHPVFDMPHYRRLTASRDLFLRRVVPALRRELELVTSLDVGCGVGFFSGLLADLGLQVVGLDGRSENVDEARRRYPQVAFHYADVEDPALAGQGEFDLVLCFGLLYHLENPFRAVRNLHALTGKIVLIESMVVPEERTVLAFRDEGPTEDQGLRHMAFYPSEACLVKMLYRAGFSRVYGFSAQSLPDHPDFHSSRSRRRVRTLLVAARTPVAAPFLKAIAEPATPADPWATAWAPLEQQVARISQFLSKPWPEKWAAVRRKLGKAGA